MSQHMEQKLDIISAEETSQEHGINAWVSDTFVQQLATNIAAHMNQSTGRRPMEGLSTTSSATAGNAQQQQPRSISLPSGHHRLLQSTATGPA
jgi:hypothetical protein